MELPAFLDAMQQEKKAWAELTELDLEEMIRTASKERYEISGGRIRALYGHSVPGKLLRTPAQPPELLYHGTAPATVELIRKSGLAPMRRQYIHLGADRVDAVAVGKRKASNPTILVINALEGYRDGVPFYAGNEKIWLADHVAPGYIRFEEVNP